MSNMVVHCKKEKYDVYIGRPSPWSNQFTHLDYETLAKWKVASRDEAVKAYEKWIRSKPELMAKAKRELKGKILGCWCKPQSCHGDVLAKIANEED